MRKLLKKYKPLTILLVLGFLLRIVLSIQIYSGDVNNHISWGRDIVENGTRGIYEREFAIRYGTMTPTYPPIPLFFFTPPYYLYDATYKVSWMLNLKYPIFPSNLIFFLEDQDTLPAYLKTPAIFADLFLAVVIYAFVKRILKDKEKLALVFSALVIFNPAFIYSSAYWGQIESTPLVFLMLSFYLLLFSKRAYLSAVFLTLAFLTKQTSIIFAPIFSIVYLRQFGFRKSVNGFLISLAVFFVAFLPFYKSGNILTFPYLTYWNKIQTGSGSDYVTDHAFNTWALLTGLGKISDKTQFIALSYRVWGYLMFSGLLLITLPKLIIEKIDKKSVLMAGVIVSMGAFLLLTRMHSRYITQALPFILLLAAYGLKSGKKKLLYLYIFVSAFLFINMYHNWWAPRIDVLVTVVSNMLFINSMIVLLIAAFIVLIYKYFRKEYT
jgi:Gpi18-like mannosyltransferase